MEKIKIRCLEENIDLPHSAGKYKIFKVLNGGWTSYKLFQCKSCEEIFVYDFYGDTSPNLDEKCYCPNCHVSLKKNIIEYPKQIIINNKIIETEVDFNYIQNIEDSIMREFYLLPLPTGARL